MKEYWSEKAKSLKPYTAGEQPKEKLIKLNTNENAYPPSPKVAEAIAGATERLRLYPDPNADELRAAIAHYHNVAPSQVFCANGSDEALALCFAAFFAGGPQDGHPGGWFPNASVAYGVKVPDVTYSFYPVWAKLFDVPLDVVPLLDDYTVDVERMCGGAGVVLANPNAPTGVALSVTGLLELIEHTNGVALIDEAYAPFCGTSAIPFVQDHDNLVVVRTLSKGHSLAGLRVGYVIADENLIAALNTVKDSFNSYPVDALAQAGAIAAIKDEAYYEKTALDIIDTRIYVIGELWKLGVSCLPSEANFLFVRFKDAPGMMRALRERGVLVRHFDGPRTKDFLRVTIGTREEMDAFIMAVKEIIQ